MYQKNIRKIFLFFIIPMIVWILTYLFNSIFYSYLSSIIGFFLSSNFLIKLLKKNFKFKPLLTSSVLIIIFTNLSWMISSFFSFIFNQQNIFYNIELYLNINPNNFIFSIIYTYIFCIICLFLSFTKTNLKEEFKISFTIKKFKFYDLKKLLQINLIILIIEIYLLSSDTLGYRGYNIEGYEEGIIKWYIPFLNYLIYFQIPLLIFIFNHYDKKKFAYLNLQLIVSICILLIIFFSKNRRDIVFLLLQFLFWFSIINQKIYIKKILFPGIILILVSFQATKYNNIIRYELYSQNFKNKSFLNIIKESIQSRNLKQLELDQYKKLKENLTFRPLTLSALTTLIEAPDDEKHFLLGKNIFNNLVWTVPRLIYPNKINTPIAENLINENFRVNFQDIGQNLILLSYVDFSYLGLIIYPLLLYFFWIINLKVINSKNISDLVKIFMIASTFDIILNSFEIATLTYFITLRNLLIIFLIYKIFNVKSFKI